MTVDLVRPSEWEREVEDEDAASALVDPIFSRYEDTENALVDPIRSKSNCSSPGSFPP